MFTPEEKNLLVDTVNQTWQLVASDWYEMGGGSSLKEVLEATLDADRWVMYSNTKKEDFAPILKKIEDLKWGSKKWLTEMKSIFKGVYS